MLRCKHCLITPTLSRMRSLNMNLRTVVIQVNTRDNPAENLSNVERFLDRAADMGAQFVGLPEFWTYLGPYSGFDSAAQTIPGPIIEVLQEKARKHKMIVHGGSIVERDPQLAGKFYNTSVLINRDAEIDGITFGLTICYDLRFPELYRLLALKGAQIIMVPAGFTLHTGRDHWEVLLLAYNDS